MMEIAVQTLESLETAKRLTGLEDKYLTSFDATDPFNGDIRLEGYLSQRPDHRYGALAITHVGGEPAPQLIYATPKLHYPFGKDGSFHFPPIQRAALYEKLDGTNVLAYQYRDAAGEQHLTYKLRLSAVLRNSKWGPFLDMWRELMERFPAIPRLVEANGCHVSFEMYGARNAHLIQYDAPLETAVLFGVRPHDATVVAPFELDLLGVPGALLHGELKAGDDPVARYGEMRAEMEKRNKPVGDGTDEKIAGTEGAIWYVVEPAGRVTLWKCKPESVENIHWSTGINKKAVLATCQNCLETNDELTYEALEPLLLEEYQEDDIKKFRPIIDECIRMVRANCEFQERVMVEYHKVGISLEEDKGAVMRAMSKVFSREDMKKVHSAIVNAR